MDKDTGRMRSYVLKFMTEAELRGADVSLEELVIRYTELQLRHPHLDFRSPRKVMQETSRWGTNSRWDTNTGKTAKK